MFTTLIRNLTDAEIAANIATCRQVLHTETINGIRLDGEGVEIYRDMLSDLEGELHERSHPEDFAEVTPRPVAIDGRKIVTSHIYPPIPFRSMDWCAYFDGEEEAGGYGYGATEAEAIADFVSEHEDDFAVVEAVERRAA